MLPSFIQALLTPEPYPHTTGEIRLLQTHISWVVLTGTYVYKIKKPVDFGFLNFTSLERRKRFCLEELRLNKRFSPELYLSVHAIVPEGDGFRVAAFEAEGAVDYCVKMVQFPQENLLARLAERSRLSLPIFERFAVDLARIHAQDQQKGEFGSIDQVKRVITGNFPLPDGSPAGGTNVFVEIRSFVDDFFRKRASVFTKRVELGRIRDCHGDLHMGNLVLVGDRARAFDCIEFNDDFRWIDCISEAAFLQMDLDASGYPQFGNRFMNVYLETSGDWEGVEVLPLYLCYRAFVRGKIHALTYHDENVKAEAKDASAKASMRYYMQALQYAKRFRNPAPRLILMHGLSGSGKSTVARELAMQEGAVHIRSDAVRKHLTGTPLASHQVKAEGEGIYSQEITARTYARMTELARMVLDAGFTVILDARYPKVEQRQSAIATAVPRNVPVEIVSCEAPPQELVRRLSQREGDISDATAELLAHQQAENEGFTAEEKNMVTRSTTLGPS